MKRRFWTALVCLLLAAALLVSPVLADGLLDPPANGCVLDVAGVLESDTIEHIVSQNETLSSATGAAIVVVTVDFLGGKDIDDYALDLFNSWGVGDADKDNGVLVLLAIGEEDYYVLQGTGLQRALPSSTLGEFTWNYLENDFANENYDDGLHKLFDALYAWFEDYYASDFSSAGPTATQSTAPVPSERPHSLGSIFKGFQERVFLSALVVIAVVIFFIVLITILASRPRRYSSGYYGRSSFWGRPRRHRPPRPPRPPRQPRPPRGPGGFGGYGGGFGGMLGGGGSRGGGAGRSSGPVHRSSGGTFRASGGGRSLGGGSSRGGGAGRRH